MYENIIGNYVITSAVRNDSGCNTVEDITVDLVICFLIVKIYTVSTTLETCGDLTDDVISYYVDRSDHIASVMYNTAVCGVCHTMVEIVVLNGNVTVGRTKGDRVSCCIIDLIMRDDRSYNVFGKLDSTCIRVDIRNTYIMNKIIIDNKT